MRLSQFNKYIGIPFANRGESESGADCIGLARLIYRRELNIELPRYNIDAENSRGVYRIFTNEVGKWERNITPEKYDIVAMANDPKHPKVIQHFGIMISDKQMLHTLKDIGAHIMSIDDSYYKNTIKGFYKWRI